MNKHWLGTLLVGATLAFMAASAWTDDLNPPPWRGDPGSTFQKWEFLTDDITPAPDQVNNPYGSVVAGINGHAYYDSDGSRVGIWSLSGLMGAVIPNTPWDYDKCVWLQLTWRPTAGGLGVPLVGVVDPASVSWSLTSVVNQTLPDGWSYALYVGCITPNPQWELVLVGGDIDVDEVVVDTICPEPQTYALFAGLGLLGFGIWRRLRT